MSQQVIAVLQRSLMENEQLSRPQVAAFAVLFLATIGIYSGLDIWRMGQIRTCE
jgi:hypothetical protein